MLTIGLTFKRVCDNTVQPLVKQSIFSRTHQISEVSRLEHAFCTGSFVQMAYAR